MLCPAACGNCNDALAIGSPDSVLTVTGAPQLAVNISRSSSGDHIFASECSIDLDHSGCVS